MRRYSQRNNLTTLSEINVTPLLDLAFVLLIIFMITTPQVVDSEMLTAQLAQLKQTNPDVAVVIRPDRELPVQKLITLMDTLRRAQITKVGIATKADTK